MGRRRQSDYHLPPRMRFKHGAFYYDHRPYKSADGKSWEWLSKDISQAKIRWAQVESEKHADSHGTVKGLWNYYLKNHFNELAESTQKIRITQGEKLVKVFGHMILSAVKPTHIAEYLDRSQAKISANREIAILSVMFSIAMRKGWAHHNPCLGISRNKETPRHRYIEDWEFLAIKSIATNQMQAILDFAYLTTWRQSDILGLRLSQLQDDGIKVTHGKTKRKQMIMWTPALRGVIERLNQLRRKCCTEYLINSSRATRYTSSGFKANWQRLMRKALKEKIIEERFTFHDIRAKGGTDAELQGKDPQKLLGHTSRKQTETYLRSKKIDVVVPVDPGKLMEEL